MQILDGTAFILILAQLTDSVLGVRNLAALEACILVQSVLFISNMHPRGTEYSS